MEIMNRVADHVKRKSWTYYISICFLFFITIVIIYRYMRILVCPSLNKIQIISSNIVEWVMYSLLPSFEFAIVCIWFYYAPVVIRGLESLRSAFLGVTEYESLYNSYARWMEQFNLRHPGKNRLFKVCYIFFWAMFLIGAWVLSWTMYGIKGNSGNILVLLCMVLVSSTIILNFSSYYICIIFVYFLIQVYHLGQAGKLKYEKSLPSATFGFQLLIHTAGTIQTYFLLDSFLSTISFYCYWQIIEKNIKNTTDWRSWLVTSYIMLFTVIFGLMSWFFIVLMARTYLYRLHNEWKFKSLQEINENSEREDDRNSEEEILAKKEKLIGDKVSISWWECLISLVVLAAHIGTALPLFNVILDTIK